MSITLRELLQIPQLANIVVAGADGLDRPVAWAHACEMPAPWDWLGPDELLMTIGHCVPLVAGQQVAFVQHLARCGLAGIVISNDGPAPPLTRSMLDAAEQLRFPILMTGHTTPFSVIARAVASANQHEQLRRLSRLSRLSTELGRPTHADDRPLLSRIAAELGHPVHVIDARHGTEIFAAFEELDPRVGPAVVAEVAERTDHLPARLHIDLVTTSVTCYPLPVSGRPAMLVVPDSAAHLIDLFALLHVANLLALEVERLVAQYAGRQRHAAALFGQLLESRLDTQSAGEQLTQVGLIFPLVLAASGVPVPVELLLDRGTPHLASDVSAQILLIGAGDISLLAALVGDQHPIGTSEVIHSTSRINDAVREARWALESARAQGGGHVAYADSQPVFLPRTVAEAVNVTRKILGPLLDHDASSGSDLVRTLEVYLACDRSWKNASEVLHIHRQTIGYRLSQIENLTDRRLTRTSDIAELWLALLALKIVQHPQDTPARKQAHPRGDTSTALLDSGLGRRTVQITRQTPRLLSGDDVQCRTDFG